RQGARHSSRRCRDRIRRSRAQRSMAVGETSMATALEPTVWTAVDLVERFGAIPLDRIRTTPPPGLATEEDAIELTEKKVGIFELVDGILVGKDMGAFESMIAGEILSLLRNFVRPRKLGVVIGEAGMLRLAPGRISISA